MTTPSSSPILDLAFCLHQGEHGDPYVMALAACYVSIRQRTLLRIHLHVICDSTLTRQNRERLKDCMMREDQLQFYPAEGCEEAFDLASELECDFSPAMIWRAWLPDYLNGLEKVLSLDCDLLCLMDLALIWNTNLTGYCLSAPLRKTTWNAAYHEVIRTPPERYFRNGFCLMNLKAIREKNDFTEGRAEFLSRSIEREAAIQKLVLWEQSLFNYYFSNVTLPMHINLIPVERMEGHPLEKEYRKALKQGRRIILDVKGWHNLTLYSNEFWRLLLCTPWRDAALPQLRTSNF